MEHEGKCFHVNRWILLFFGQPGGVDHQELKRQSPGSVFFPAGAETLLRITRCACPGDI